MGTYHIFITIDFPVTGWFAASNTSVAQSGIASTHLDTIASSDRITSSSANASLAP